jgi:hypothetical protein
MFRGYWSSAGAVRQKRRKKIPSKFYLLRNKRRNPLPPSMFNEPGTVYLLFYSHAPRCHLLPLKLLTFPIIYFTAY